jgi:RND family efflux transporter MFP subunit
MVKVLIPITSTSPKTSSHPPGRWFEPTRLIGGPASRKPLSPFYLSRPLMVYLNLNMKLITWIKSHWKASLAGLISLLIPSVYAAKNSSLPVIGKQTTYETVAATTQDIKETISLSGTVEASEEASLKFQAGGLLTWVGVKEGDFVKKYQAIASLDKRELEQNFKKEANNYLTDRWDFEQIQDDYKETKNNYLVTDSIKRILEKAQFSLENSVVDYELKDLAIRLATIHSPIEGIVVRVDSPKAGVNVTPATATFEIVNPNTIYFSAEVDETDVSQIKIGARAVITLDAYPDEEIESTVNEISFVPKSGSQGTVYEVKLSLSQNSLNLKYKLGFNGDARITVKQKQGVLTVPSQVIKLKDGKTVIYILKDGKEQEVEIETGIENEDSTEIIKGDLTVDDQIITDPNGNQ